MSVKAALTLKQDSAPTIGQERIRLLEAVAREGSIAAAARAVGLSYKASWDALNAMQNLVNQPILVKSSGGRRGGGASLTPAGITLIETFHQLESGLALMLNEAACKLEGIGLSSTGLIQGFMMKTSARNLLAGKIIAIDSIALASSVTIEIAPNIVIRSDITSKSVKELGLVVGRNIAALIKASFVSVTPGAQASPSQTDNVVVGQLQHIEIGPKTAELIIDIGDDRTLVATLDVATAHRQKFTSGEIVSARFATNHVIIAAF